MLWTMFRNACSSSPQLINHWANLWSLYWQVQWPCLPICCLIEGKITSSTALKMLLRMTFPGWGMLHSLQMKYFQWKLYQRNFNQWARVNRDSYKPRNEHSARHEDRRDNKSQSRSFCPYHKSSATSSSATSSSTNNRAKGCFSSRPFRGRGGRRKWLLSARRTFVHILAGMGSKECTSKGGDHFEGGLLSEFQISTSIDKLSCNKEQVFEPGETTVFDKGGLSNDQQKSNNSSSKLKRSHPWDFTVGCFLSPYQEWNGDQ